MFKLFFKYLDDFLVFWMDDLLIYGQTGEEHFKHLQLVFEKFQEGGIKLKMYKCEFFKNEIEHLIPGQGISPLKPKTNLAPMTNITEVKHMIGYYRKFFPMFSDIIRPLNELSKKNVPFKWTKQCQKSLKYMK